MSYTNGIGDWKQIQNPIAPASTTEVQKGNPAKAAESQKIASPHTDKAQLSPASELLANGVEGSDVRGSKVEALQKAIADGSYKVSSGDVADKIIQSLLGS
ncbi:flagellar biosynthesis anti-sigma factor FlgM [Edaphobacter albus]|uniref:flagellar biosynthesis anti-sigma factor FlgM n=1 Tax=Edaphobacter sp. 4G125 TaxID=2763071 RepID=UPI0016489732|nr:flagellar biosynthesis anti-sigma factor FlgM [Edaphobacter sp. 4G125]QNI35304.1 flagellar biosynthesis anti-sigma factor FlgM [Edaphobacter sp. 4G125]